MGETEALRAAQAVIRLSLSERLAPGGRRNRGYPRGPCAGRQWPVFREPSGRL